MSDARSVWGDSSTRYFFELTPDRVLSAVEKTGLLLTGRCTSLNSFENRVYEIELENEDPLIAPHLRRRVVKFYRPGRWSLEQIEEEHRFLLDLLEAEIPVVAPLADEQGKTLHVEEPSGIAYAVFPKFGGRAPDELDEDQLRRIGRLLARIHAIGTQRPTSHRLEMSAETYGRKNLNDLIEGNWIPPEVCPRYAAVVTEITAIAEAQFAKWVGRDVHRIHGDCHLGNLLMSATGSVFLDFDDMLKGPAIQDVWLLTPGRDAESARQREALLEGYEEMRPFPRKTLRMVETLRALRMIHYTAWIARRWNDPAFPAAFPQFGSHSYWNHQLQDLELQLRLMKAESETDYLT